MPKHVSVFCFSILCGYKVWWGSIIISATELISRTQTQNSPHHLIWAGAGEPFIHQDNMSTLITNMGTKRETESVFILIVAKAFSRWCHSKLWWWKCVESCDENIIPSDTIVFWWLIIFHHHYYLLLQIYSGSVLETNCPHQQINIRLKIAQKYTADPFVSIGSVLGDWCFCCSVRRARDALTQRPPYPGHRIITIKIVKTRTSLLTDWALSRCDDIICDGHCLSQLRACVSSKNPAATDIVTMRIVTMGKMGRRQ